MTRVMYYDPDSPRNRVHLQVDDVRTSSQYYYLLIVRPVFAPPRSCAMMPGGGSFKRRVCNKFCQG